MSIPQMMRAVTIDGFGEPNVLRLGEIEVPPLRDGEVRRIRFKRIMTRQGLMAGPGPRIRRARPVHEPFMNDGAHYQSW
jgi:hypothetical protein